MFALNVKRVSVLIRTNHKDRISFYLAASSPFNNGEDACAEMDAAKGTGVDWVRDNMELEPEIIDASSKNKMKFSREE